jgi:hypothetical protein
LLRGGGQAHDAGSAHRLAKVQAQRERARAGRFVVDEHDLDRVVGGRERRSHEVGGDFGRAFGGERGRQRTVAGERARQQECVPLRLGAQRPACERRRVGCAHRRVPRAVSGGALEVDPGRSGRHRLRDVAGGPQRRGERVADAGHAAARDGVGLVYPQRVAVQVGDLQVGRERARLEVANDGAQQLFDRGRGSLGTSERVVVSGQERRLLRERLLFAPFSEHARARHVGSRDRHPRRERFDRFAVAGDLFLIALGDPRQLAKPVRAVGVGLVADLHGGEVGPERAVGCRHLACGGHRFVMGQADREQHLPAAAAGEHADLVHLCRADAARGPRGQRGGRVCPGDVLIGGDASEAEHSRPQRAQQVDEVAAVGVVGDLVERGRLEGEAEESLGHECARIELVDRHAHRDLGRQRLRRRPAFAGGRRAFLGGAGQRCRRLAGGARDGEGGSAQRESQGDGGEGDQAVSGQAMH